MSVRINFAQFIRVLRISLFRRVIAKTLSCIESPFKATVFLTTGPGKNFSFRLTINQGVTNSCHLSLLTNSALLYESRCERMGWGGGGCGVSSNEYSCAAITWHGAKINFGDLPPYLTYAISLSTFLASVFWSAATRPLCKASSTQEMTNVPVF